MFNRYNEVVRGKKQWYRIGQNLPILGAGALLADKRYTYCVDHLKQLCGLPEEYYQHFYQSFIQRFAEFAQTLPEKLSEPLGSLLSNSLLRGLNTLYVFVTQYDDPTPLECYALFTACVLRDIHSVVTNQKILVTAKGGSTLHIWQPFCGPLTEEEGGVGYKIMPLSSAYQRAGKQLRPVLARQVIGEGGYLWIASDLRLLAEWLEALNEEDEEGSGRLVHVIKRYRREGGGLVDTLPAVKVDLLDSPDTEYADQFYQWLIEGVNNGSIKVNRADAHVHVTDAGVFVEGPAIFKTFADLYNVPVNQFVVFTQLGNLLGIARKGGSDFHASVQATFKSPGIISGKASVAREGFVIGDANSVFINGKTPDAAPYIRVPASLKQSSQALADFNAATKPNLTMKNR